MQRKALTDGGLINLDHADAGCFEIRDFVPYGVEMEKKQMGGTSYVVEWFALRHRGQPQE